jgi:hypothetical protein
MEVCKEGGGWVKIWRGFIEDLTRGNEESNMGAERGYTSRAVERNLGRIKFYFSLAF